MIRNSMICKLINVQASMKENNEKKIKNEDEISKLIKALPKDIAAVTYLSNRLRDLDNRSIHQSRDLSWPIIGLVCGRFLHLFPFPNNSCVLSFKTSQGIEGLTHRK